MRGTAGRRAAPPAAAVAAAVAVVGPAALAAAVLAGCSGGSVATGPAGTATADGVAVVVDWDPAVRTGDARALTVTVTPSAPDGRVAASTTVVTGRALSATGPLTPSAAPAEASVGGKDVPLYPAGPVTFRLPVRLGEGVDPLSRGPAGTLLVTVTTCTADACSDVLTDHVVSLGPPPE